MDRKPELIVRLLAGDTVVDESTDAALWQRVLAAIRGIEPLPDATRAVTARQDPLEPPSPPALSSGAPIAAFARELDVTEQEVMGGLGPQQEEPYIHLDEKYWESLKKNTPKRGPGGVSAYVLAATALVLWQRHGRTPDVTTATAKAVCDRIHLSDANGYRSIANCHWLQSRGGRLVPNPHQISHGIRLLNAYCKKGPLSDAA